VFRPEINAPQEHLYLLAVYFPGFFIVSWPGEAVFFQSLHDEAETIPVPVQAFDQRSLPVAEHEKVAGKRFLFHHRFYDDGKAVDLLAHISGTWPDKDTNR